MISSGNIEIQSKAFQILLDIGGNYEFLFYSYSNYNLVNFQTELINEGILFYLIQLLQGK